MSKASLENEVKKQVLDTLIKTLQETFDTDVLYVAAGELTMPTLFSDGTEGFINIKVSTPRGQRVDGTYEPYDGYAAAEEWKVIVQEREDKIKARKERDERKEQEKIRKRNARKVVKKLNEVGINKMIHEKDDDN